MIYRDTNFYWIGLIFIPLMSHQKFHAGFHTDDGDFE